MFTFSWILINLGISLFLINIKEIGINIELLNINTVYFFIGLANAAFLIISYIFNYKDGIKAFHSTYYINYVMLLTFSFGILNLNDFVHLILALVAFNLGVYSFINFIILPLKKDNCIIPYVTFLYFILTCLIGVYIIFSDNIYYAVSTGQIFLLLLFLYIYLIGIFKKKILQKEKELERKEDHQYQELRDILKEKDEDKKPIKVNKFLKWIVLDVDEFLKNNPASIKIMLSLLNVILIFVQIYLLFKNFTSGNSSIINEVFYWSSVCIFFANFLLLKSIDYFYFIQRAFVFFIINFGIYISLLDLFGTKDLLFIATIGIIWNIANSVIILGSKKLNLNKILYSEDYYRWILANISATITNLYFLFKIEANNFIKISIVFMYLGIILILLFYNIKYINSLTVKE
ncbi:MAG: hypothetical protein V3575_03170 [Candidatus Absconditabacteria bacterium]